MTAAGRKTASKIAVGDVILVVTSPAGSLWPTTKKHTGRNEVQLAVVEKLRSELYSEGRRKAQRQYVFQTDQGIIYAAPSETFAVLPPEAFDTASPNSRQHYIDTGRYLTHVEQKTGA